MYAREREKESVGKTTEIKDRWTNKFAVNTNERSATVTSKQTRGKSLENI